MSTTHPPTIDGIVCPSWCDDHELLLGDSSPHKGEVLSNRHQRAAVTQGDLSLSVRRYIDDPPLDGPWPRAYIVADSRHGVQEKRLSVSIGGLSVDEVRWLATELVRAAELLAEDGAS